MPSPADLPPPDWDRIIPRAVHDMRTPLSALLTGMELVRRITPPAPATEKVLALMDSQLADLAAQLDTLLGNPRAFLESP